MLSLAMLLLEHVGLITILAYVLMSIPYFKNLMNRRRTWKARWQSCIIFGSFALVSNLTDIAIDHQHSLSGSVYFRLDDDIPLANTRVLTVGITGLAGGPFVGLFVGVISDIFRVCMGGADAQVYLISSIFIGIIAGYFDLRAQRRERCPSIAKSAMIGIVMEMIQMLSILTFSHDKVYAADLISLIALPTVIISSVGTAIFTFIVISTLK